MKRFIYIFFLFTIISCSSDDDNPGTDVNSSALGGKWNLVNISGGFLGVDHDFENGVIIWDFNENSKTITVTNNNTDTTINDILPTGTYPYSLMTIQGNQELFITEISRGNFELSGNEFIINEQFKDGMRIIFRR